jgi:hypothetical protein
LLCFTHFEFDFLGGNNLFVRTEVGAEISRYRTKMPAGTNYQRCADLAIHHPVITLMLQAFERLAQHDARTAALQQVIVELKTADAVADRHCIIGIYLCITNGAGDESPNRLKYPALCIV